MGWKIYYADGKVYCNNDGSPYEAPGLGVVVIIQTCKVQGFRTVKGDYYIYQTWGWEGCDIFGLWDYLAGTGTKTVKFGRTLDNADFERIYNQALAEGKSI